MGPWTSWWQPSVRALRTRNHTVWVVSHDTCVRARAHTIIVHPNTPCANIHRRSLRHGHRPVGRALGGALEPAKLGGGLLPGAPRACLGPHVPPWLACSRISHAHSWWLCTHPGEHVAKAATCILQNACAWGASLVPPLLMRLCRRESAERCDGSGVALAKAEQPSHAFSGGGARGARRQAQSQPREYATHQLASTL